MSQHWAIKIVGQLEISLIMCIAVSVLMIHYVDLFGYRKCVLIYIAPFIAQGFVIEIHTPHFALLFDPWQ